MWYARNCEKWTICEHVNMAMVSYIVNIGQGYLWLEEFLATMNTPNMSNYIKIFITVFLDT